MSGLNGIRSYSRSASRNPATHRLARKAFIATNARNRQFFWSPSDSPIKKASNDTISPEIIGIRKPSAHISSYTNICEES
jgi:hypothetical protein